jgi:hypothetical protein
VLVAISRFIAMLANLSVYVRTTWFELAPSNIPFLGTATASLILGLVAPYLLNIVLAWTGIMTVIDAKTEAIARHGNDLLRLLHGASLEEKPVSIALDNGKVYIGLIAAAPNLSPHDTYLSMTPLYSGYRNKQTLQLVFTVDYLEVYEARHLDPKDFRVVVPMASIRMASLFDQAAYASFRVESDTGSDQRVASGAGSTPS